MTSSKGVLSRRHRAGQEHGRSGTDLFELSELTRVVVASSSSLYVAQFAKLTSVFVLAQVLADRSMFV